MGTLLIVTSKILIICAVYGFIRYAVYVIKSNLTKWRE